jgi:hypothetical protein
MKGGDKQVLGEQAVLFGLPVDWYRLSDMVTYYFSIDGSSARILN